MTTDSSFEFTSTALKNLNGLEASASLFQLFPSSYPCAQVAQHEACVDTHMLTLSKRFWPKEIMYLDK